MRWVAKSRLIFGIQNQDVILVLAVKASFTIKASQTGCVTLFAGEGDCIQIPSWAANFAFRV